mgnify:CR=1 FL=1
MVELAENRDLPFNVPYFVGFIQPRLFIHFHGVFFFGRVFNGHPHDSIGAFTQLPMQFIVCQSLLGLHVYSWILEEPPPFSSRKIVREFLHRQWLMAM